MLPVANSQYVLNWIKPYENSILKKVDFEFNENKTLIISVENEKISIDGSFESKKNVQEGQCEKSKIRKFENFENGFLTITRFGAYRSVIVSPCSETFKSYFNFLACVFKILEDINNKAEFAQIQQFHPQSSIKFEAGIYCEDYNIKALGTSKALYLLIDSSQIDFHDNPFMNSFTLMS